MFDQLFNRYQQEVTQESLPYFIGAVFGLLSKMESEGVAFTKDNMIQVMELAINHATRVTEKENYVNTKII